MAYDLYGNYIPDGGGGKSGFYSPQNISGMISSPNDGGFNANYGKSYSQQAPPPLTAQQLAATGFNPNYGQSYFQPNPAGSLAPIQQMKSIPLSQMDLSNGTLAPGVLSGGVETATNLVGGATGLGGAVGAVGGALTKLNPYLAMGTAALGAIQTIGGLVGLARTKQPEGFKLTPKMQQAIGESETAARYGLGPQQIALALQNQREAQNTQLYNARSMAGGNLSRAIFGANTYSRLMAGNQLAAQDFAAQQQKIGLRNQLYGQEQGIANQNVQLAQQDYMRKQQAYGGAMSSGLTNLGSFFNLQNALRYNA
jgi:hypothetical protein